MEKVIRVKVEISGIGKNMYWNQSSVSTSLNDNILDAAVLQTFLDEFFKSFTDDCCDILINGEEQWQKNIDNNVRPIHTEQRKKLDHASLLVIH